MRTPVRHNKSLRKSKRRSLTSKLVLLVLAGVFLTGFVVSRPAWHLLTAWNNEESITAPAPAGTVNDASHLNETEMAKLLEVPADRSKAEEQLRQLLFRARSENLRVSVAGARHSMGGHTIYPGGIAVDMLPFNHMKLDTANDILHVGSGARWSEVLPYLNNNGKSVAVMQSNNSFSVGGSISVNCHGWQTGKPPISSTVESLRLMRHDGTVTTCSRTENSELFSLVLGGYGLFGIILDVELRVVPNEMLRLKRTPVTIADYADAQEKLTEETTSAALAYGRLDVTSENLLRSALINVWARDPGLSCTTAPMAKVSMPSVRRAIFRGSVGDSSGKNFRWWAERELEPLIGSPISTRNELLNVGVELFENRSSADTDILHEYFVPPDQFEAFVDSARSIIKEHNGDLLNLTVRDVEADTDTFLRYADQKLLCLVMLFNQQKSEVAELQMAQLTQDLIDAALDSGGRYYLTYRLHATQSQIRQAYPQLDDFFVKKREYDPAEIFQNQFYRKYALQDAASP